MGGAAIVAVFFFVAALLVPAGAALAGGEYGGCGFGAYKALEAKKDAKEVEAGYVTLVKQARKDGKISDAERVTLDFYRLQYGMSLARAKVIETNES